MKCKKCGHEHFTLSARFITEYHDATIRMTGTVVGGVVDVKHTEPEGSFYLYEAEATCSNCGNKVKLAREGAWLEDNNVLEELERNPFGR